MKKIKKIRVTKNMKELKIGNEYRLNEDIKELIKLDDNADATPISAGTKCKLIELDGEFVTLEFDNGQKVRTESHMID